MKKHYDEIDRLRGLAILMVILYHAVIVYPINLHEIPWCKALHEFLWYMEMPLFFVVSGFCFSYSCRYGSYVSKKVKRILVPHLLFGVLDVLPRIISNPFVNQQSEAAPAIRNFLLYGGSDWFLRALFMIVMIFPLMDKLYHRGKWEKIAMPVLVCLLYAMSGSITNIMQLRMAAVYLAFFTIGYLIRQLDYEKTVRPLFIRGSVCLISLLTMAVMFLAYRRSADSALSQWFQLIGGAVGSVFFYGAAVRLKGMPGKLLKLCGGYSLQMYLLGGYALVVSRTVLVSLLGVQNAAMIIAGNFILDILLTLCISRYILDRFKPFRMVSGLGR